MKIAVWVLFGLLAMCWTGGAWLAATLAQWAAGLLASGAAADLMGAAAQWPVPEWLTLWFDPALVRAVQAMLVQALEWTRESMPAAGSAVGWLVPVVWVLWGLGMALMLALAGGAHLLAGRFLTPRPSPS
jgi:hypothetical protein